jgi:hypothetical protein
MPEGKHSDLPRSRKKVCKQSRGLEFHHQLNLNSFDFHVDAEGDEYATINHETQQKNIQGGIM